MLTPRELVRIDAEFAPSIVGTLVCRPRILLLCNYQVGPPLKIGLMVLDRRIGMLLESYLTLCGGHDVRRLYISMRVGRLRRNEGPPAAAVTSVIRTAQFALYGFLLLVLGRGRDRVGDPLYQMSSFLKSRGLSNQGMSVVSRFGWCYPKSTFLRHRDGSLAILGEELRFGLLCSCSPLFCNETPFVALCEISFYMHFSISLAV